LAKHPARQLQAIDDHSSVTRTRPMILHCVRDQTTGNSLSASQLHNPREGVICATGLTAPLYARPARIGFGKIPGFAWPQCASLHPSFHSSGEMRMTRQMRNCCRLLQQTNTTYACYAVRLEQPSMRWADFDASSSAERRVAQRRQGPFCLRRILDTSIAAHAQPHLRTKLSQNSGSSPPRSTSVQVP
jgi:hypothetical protein